jgi:hypothetical protein
LAQIGPNILGRARRNQYGETPGLDGAPAGGKAEIADELRRIAADARRKRA